MRDDFVLLVILFSKGLGLHCSVRLRAMSALVSSSSAPLAEREVQQVKLPDGIIDKHGGVIVEMNAAMDPQLFASLLRNSVPYWREQVIINISRAFNLISLLPAQDDNGIYSYLIVCV